jgi:hypothetical protein
MQGTVISPEVLQGNQLIYDLSDLFCDLRIKVELPQCLCTLTTGL